eukprot:3494356-Pyramimonas_sp.AAC.2
MNKPTASSQRGITRPRMCVTCRKAFRLGKFLGNVVAIRKVCAHPVTHIYQCWATTHATFCTIDELQALVAVIAVTSLSNVRL